MKRKLVKVEVPLSPLKAVKAEPAEDTKPVTQSLTTVRALELTIRRRKPPKKGDTAYTFRHLAEKHERLERIEAIVRFPFHSLDSNGEREKEPTPKEDTESEGGGDEDDYTYDPRKKPGNSVSLLFHLTKNHDASPDYDLTDEMDAERVMSEPEFEIFCRMLQQFHLALCDFKKITVSGVTQLGLANTQMLVLAHFTACVCVTIATSGLPRYLPRHAGRSPRQQSHHTPAAGVLLHHPPLPPELLQRCAVGHGLILRRPALPRPGHSREWASDIEPSGLRQRGCPQERVRWLERPSPLVDPGHRAGVALPACSHRPAAPTGGVRQPAGDRAG